MKKLIIALIFAQASCFASSVDSSLWRINSLRQAEEDFVTTLAHGTKYCAQGLLNVSFQLDKLAVFIKNKATEDQIKTYAFISALFGIYLLYKSLPSKQKSTQPANASSNLTGNK